MTTDDLIRDLCSWVQTLPKPMEESDLHNQVLEKLKTMNLRCVSKGKIPNLGARGVSEPDVLVTSVVPQLLVEFKATGDWRHVSEAAWQLFQAADLLQTNGTTTRKLAIFGSKINDPILWKMLRKLEIEAECVQG